MKKDIRNLIRNGDSTSVTIPPSFLEKNELQIGDQIEIFYDEILILKPVSQGEIETQIESVLREGEEIKDKGDLNHGKRRNQDSE